MQDQIASCTLVHNIFWKHGVSCMEAKIPRDALYAKINAVPFERMRNSALDPYPGDPDHAYWARVLKVAARRDSALCSMLHIMRVLGARLTITERGHLKLDIHPMFCVDPPEIEDCTEEEFKARYLEPNKQAIVAILREAEKEI